ncbi:MAG: tetratricopeptide repeat protein, partial [Candidatus Omnitrophota bacterium]
TQTQIKDYEIKLAQIRNEKELLENQLKDLRIKERAWQIKTEEFAVAFNEKEKTIEDAKRREENVINQMQNYQAKSKDLEAGKEQLSQKNKMLFKDNMLLKRKLESYPRKLYQIALMKDRLLKENAVLHYNLGVFYLQRQEYNEAIVEFEKVLELNPNDAATHYNLGIVYADYLGNRNKAIMHFKRYIMGASKDDKDAERAKKYILTWEMWEDEKVERSR